MKKNILPKNNFNKDKLNEKMNNLLNKYKNKEIEHNSNIKSNQNNILSNKINNNYTNLNLSEQKITKKSLKNIFNKDNNNNSINEVNKINNEENINFKENLKNLIKEKIKKKFHNINNEIFEIPPNLDSEINFEKVKKLLDLKTMNDEKKLEIYQTEIFNFEDIKKGDKKKFSNKNKKISSYFILFRIIIDKELEILNNYYESKNIKVDNFSELANLIHSYLIEIMKIMIEEYKSFKIEYKYKFNKTNIYNRNQNKYLKLFLEDIKNINIDYENNQKIIETSDNNLNIIENKIRYIKNENNNNFFLQEGINKENLKKINKNIINKINSNLSKKFNIINDLNLEIQKILKRINKLEENNLNLKNKIKEKSYDQISNYFEENSLDLFKKFINN